MRGGRILFELGPSWNIKAVFLIPYDILLIPSKVPDIGLVTSPAKPLRAPVTPPKKPFLLYPSTGCLTRPVIATYIPV